MTEEEFYHLTEGLSNDKGHIDLESFRTLVLKRCVCEDITAEDADADMLDTHKR